MKKSLFWKDESSALSAAMIATNRSLVAIIAAVCATINIFGNSVGIETISTDYDARVGWIIRPLVGNDVFGSISKSSLSHVSNARRA